MKRTNFYSQGQRRAARVLFIVWLLARCSLDVTLAVPRSEKTIVPASSPTPSYLPLASPPPQPGGILPLPPDSPCSFWGSRVASSAAIDTALQRQPASSLLSRTTGKLTSRFWRPSPQAALRIQAGPVAEGDEAGSSISQHPVVVTSSLGATSITSAPSALQQLMSQEAGVGRACSLLGASIKVRPVGENLSFQARDGEKVRFVYEKGQWHAEVLSQIGDFSRQSVLPVVCGVGANVSSTLEALSNYPSWYSQRRIHVLDRNMVPTLGEVVYLAELGLKGGGGEASASGTPQPATPSREDTATTDKGKRPTLAHQDSLRPQQRMAKGDITSTQALVEAFNTAPTPDEQTVLEKWIRAYIQWFNKQPIGNLTMKQGTIVHEYSQLAYIQSKNETSKQLLQDYYNSLCHQIGEKYNHGEEPLLVALEHTLEALDPTIFDSNPNTLIRLGNKLLAKLELSDNLFDESTFPTHQSTLHALHRVLMLINEITPTQWNPHQPDGLYQKYKKRVKDIYEETCYYPIRYHAQLLKQALRLLEEQEALLQASARRTWHFVKGMIYFYQGMPLPEIPGIGGDPKIDLGALQQSLDNMHQAFKQKRDKQWYPWFLELTAKCAPLLESRQATEGQYEEFKALYTHYLQANQQNMLQEKGRKALLYSLVMQLRKLSTQAAAEHIRDRSTDDLVSLSAHCQRYAPTLEALLDSLARLAVHGQESTKKIAKEGLESLVNISRDRQGGSVVAKRINDWLGDHTSLEDKLRSVTTPCSVPELGSLFKAIRQELQGQSALQVAAQVLKRFDDLQQQPSIRGDRQLAKRISALSDQIRHLQDSGHQNAHELSLDNHPAFRELLSKIDQIDTLLQEASHDSSRERLALPLASLHAKFNQLQEAIQAIHGQQSAPAPIIIDLQEARKALIAYYQEQKRFREVPSFFPQEPATPMEKIQCHLMLLEQVKVKEKPREEQAAASDSQEGPEDQVAAIHERIEWRKRPIEIQDLFKPRSTKPDGPTEEIHKVLLVGEAGTGKTTLSHKLVHDWACKRWGKDFTAVYLLPVRALQKEKYQGANFRTVPSLANAILEECFPARFRERDEDFRRLQAQIRQELEQSTTLVILDGLDERAGAHPNLLEEATKGKHKLLMLSRPYGIVHERQIISIEVEHQGFDDTQMDSYVQRYFQQRGAPATLSKDLLRFIKEYPAPSAISHVPVNLEILCALWRKDHKVVRQATMQGSLPGLYRKLTRYIGDRYQEEHPTAESAVQAEVFQKLGKLALNSLWQGDVQLSDEQVKDVLDESPITVAMLRASGFLQVAGREQYQFPHLTFQEYFAGRTLARQLFSDNTLEQQRAKTFLSRHKYAPQYARTLSFMAGEVSKAERVEGIQKLLRHMESDKEIVGVQHLLLQLRVIHEWLCMAQEDVEDDIAMLERELKVLASLKQWFAKGLEHVRSEDYDRDSAGRKLLALFTGSLQTFQSVVSHAPESLELLKKAAEDKSEPEYVREAALKVLSSLVQVAPAWSQEVSPSILAALKDKSEYVCSAAQEALLSLVQVAPALAQDALAIIQKALKDKDWSVRSAALGAFSSLVQIFPAQALAAFPSILEALKDEDGSVRSVAQEALSTLVQVVPGLSPEAFAIIRASCEDDRVRPAVLKALSSLVQAVPERSPEALAIILAACGKDESFSIRSTALAVLSSLVQSSPGLSPKAFAIIQASCEDDRVRSAALKALSSLVQVDKTLSKAALPIILEALKDEDWSVRPAVFGALSSLVQVDPTLSKAALPSILEALKDEDWSVRSAALGAPLLQISLEQLLESYWDRPDDSLIPYIYPRLYHTPLVVGKSPREGHKELILYATAGKPRKWTRPQEAVEHFMRGLECYEQYGEFPKQDAALTNQDKQAVVGKTGRVRNFFGKLGKKLGKKQDVASSTYLVDAAVDKVVWGRYFGHVGKNPPLTANIAEIMDSPCPFWEGQQVRDTHLLVLIPKHVGGKVLTLNYLGELIQRPQGGGYGTKYRYYPDYVREAVGRKGSGSSYWVLMTRYVLPGSRDKGYADQCKLVSDHAARTGLDYRLPSALEASVVMLLHHVRSGKRLYSDNPWTYTRCRDKTTHGYPVVVGGFSSGASSSPAAAAMSAAASALLSSGSFRPLVLRPLAIGP